MIGHVEVNNFILFNIEDDDRSGILFRIIFSIISCWNFVLSCSRVFLGIVLL